MSKGPLTGVKVIELGTLIAGPLCTRMLAEFGAEVIKIEAPEGGDQIRAMAQDVRRHVAVVVRAGAQQEVRDGQSARTRGPGDRAHGSSREADIVVENFRPGALEKWNLGWPQLSAINPGLVMVRLSGFGQDGPYRDRPGFGVVARSDGRHALRHRLSRTGRRCGSASPSAIRSLRCMA